MTKKQTTTLSTPQRSAGIDQFRLIAALMVIAIHTFPFQSFVPALDEVVTSTLFRIAVPFFFMVTGYYVLGPYGETASYPKKWKIRKTIRRLLNSYLFASLLYLPLSFYMGSLRVSMPVSSLVKVLMFDGPFYHLWYFPAMVIGLLICQLLFQSLSYSEALLASLVLYVIGLGGDSYYFLVEKHSFLKEVYSVLFHFFEYTRNGLFFSPLFLVLGAGLYLNRAKPRTFTGLKTGAALLLLAGEGLLLHSGAEPKHDSMYVFLPVAMYGLFQLVVSWNPKGTGLSADYSLWLYLLHPLSIALLYFLGKVVPSLHNSLVQFLLVVVLTLGLSKLTILLFKKRRPVEPTRIRRAGMEVNLSALGKNLQSVHAWLPKETKVMAVLKADAYGHGAVLCGRYLEQQGVGFFAVATLEEGVALRKNGLQGEILILGYTDPDDIEKVASYQLIQSVFSVAYAERLNQTGRNIRCHLEINTGMNRLGFEPVVETLLPVYGMDNLRCEGIFSHLGSSDAMEGKARLRTAEQIGCFDRLLAELKQRGVDYGLTHLQSSYGVVNYPELTYDYARIGIFLYGVLSQPDHQIKEKITLEPILSLQAVLASVTKVSAGEYLGYGTETVAENDMVVGVVSIGYADGIPRELSNTGYCTYQGYNLPQVGRICMDMLLVDVTMVPNINIGAPITVLESTEAAAAHAHTITNEILSRLGSRLERVSG